MSSDPIKIVEDLIKSGKGDPNRLQLILETLRGGMRLDYSDQKYIDDISADPISEPIDESSTDISSDIPENKSDHHTDISTEPSNDLPVKSPNDETSDFVDDSLSQKHHVPKKKVISILAVIAVILAVYVATDVYAVGSLQFRPHQGTQAIISDTQISIQSDACNPSYFPVAFNKYEIIAYYKSLTIETAEISGGAISPKSAATFDGVFTLNKDAVQKLQQENIPFDPAEAQIVTKIHSPIFGFIPYTVNKQFGAEEFQQILKNGVPGSYSC